MKNIVVVEVIEKKIYVIRGHKVMLDKDLAVLYGVPAKRLNEQVKRNISRFPEDFMFQLTKTEFNSLRFQFGMSNLRSQIATSSLRSQNATLDHGGRRYLPYVFTEQGVAMLSTVLNSERAVQVNIAIMRAFVKLREILSTHKELAAKLNELEYKVEKHNTDIGTIFEAIRQLMTPPPQPPKRRIGFHPQGG